eukprot:jgi/Undpi1/11276/HiC_scaffold_30.g13574.m1
MALRMDSAVRHSPTHHRTALPKRTSPQEPKTAVSVVLRRLAQEERTTQAKQQQVRKAPTSNNKSPLAAPRRKGAEGGGNGEAFAAGVGAGGGARGTTGAASRNGDVATGRSGGRGSGGGGGGGGIYSVARKRVRVVDPKLGEFVGSFDMSCVALPSLSHFSFSARSLRGTHTIADTAAATPPPPPPPPTGVSQVYHLRCVTPKLTELPDEELWMCPACTAEVTNRQTTKRRRLEDGGRAGSPGPGGGGRCQGSQQDKVPAFHGVKTENDAFRAFVLYKNQVLDIGLYPTAQTAARAYDRKALSLFGDAAVCNFAADEQVEVEGVGADGNTVKGVVRSFHQWRAEMQWGNKKRHLGFFDQLDHASHAYNRAALYMNGPDTALNPTKEGYLPPTPTGAPVRVPRNKLFVQQLPLPLITLAKAEGAATSAQYERRKQQMAGKYHVPLVGCKHQVSYVPPLPPPSRPWAGVTPGTAAPATDAAVDFHKVSETRAISEVSEASEISEVSSELSPPIDAAALSPALETASSVSGTSSAELQATVTVAPAAAPLSNVEDAMDVDVPVPLLPTTDTGGSFFAEVPSEARHAPTASHGSGDAPSPVVPGLVVVTPESPREKAAACSPDFVAAEAVASSPGADTESPLQVVSEVVDSLIGRAVAPAAAVAAMSSNAVSNGVMSEKAKAVPEGGQSLGQRNEASAVRLGIGPEVALAAIAAPDPPAPRVDDARGKTGGVRGGVEHAETAASLLPAIDQEAAEGERGSPSAAGTAGCSTETGNKTISTLSPPDLPRQQPSPSPSPPPSFFPERQLAPVSPNGRSLSSRISANANSVTMQGVIAAEGAASTVQTVESPQPPLPPPPPAASTTTSASPNPVSGRKRKLPSGPQVAGIAGGEGSIEENGNGGFGAGGGVDCTSGFTSPELSFEDVAELVWDPRSGPKPRRDGSRASRGSVERAMWERDSALLERVAPAHAEKAMQVLQMHRHDVERAGHMLMVRHGIPVVGLSSVRTTRNSRAEQQAASNSTTSARAATKKTDAQNVTREEARQAADAFMRHGRNLNAVAEALGWKKNRVVEYYYTVWKFSPAYQVWKTTRHQAGLPGVGGAGQASGGITSGRSASAGLLGGGGLLNATSDGMRWRGSRLRTLKTPSSQVARSARSAAQAWCKRGARAAWNVERTIGSGKEPKERLSLSLLCDQGWSVRVNDVISAGGRKGEVHVEGSAHVENDFPAVAGPWGGTAVDNFSPVADTLQPLGAQIRRLLAAGG